VPTGSFVLSKPHTNPAEVNNAVIYHLYVGDAADAALRSTLELFDQIANEPAFDQLRTKEQLGYIVQTSVTARTGELGWKVLIQSERSPEHVEARIEHFIGGMKAVLEGMSEEDFDKHRQSLIGKREEKAKNLGEETRRFWARIQDRYYEFGKRESAPMCKLTQANALSSTCAKRQRPTSSRYSRARSSPARQTAPNYRRT
jgi:insulysin